MSEERERPKWIWCLVGNVVKERPYGPNHEVRRGTKRFAPGTKVYYYPVKWGDGYERIYVLGKPREKYDLIRLIMPRKYIENFRLQKVYNPQVIERMNPSPTQRTMWTDGMTPTLTSCRSSTCSLGSTSARRRVTGGSQ